MALFDKKEDDKKDVKKTASKAVKAEVATKDLYAAETKKADGKKVTSAMAYKVLVKPLITEKAANLGHLNKYVFMVDRDANKIEVAKAINAIYGIKPTSVNIINNIGKTVTRGRIAGKKKDWRKAIVTLPKGKSISIYEGV
ncbi:MAG: 50S ribosomal protein L23 [Candidatus Falkowbacteria bacterium]